MDIETRNKIDAIWNIFFAGGISNPLTVIEQITYLLFIKSLDDKEMSNVAYYARADVKDMLNPAYRNAVEGSRGFGYKEADVFNNKISTKSPIAMAIMGKKVGDVATVKCDAGDYDVKVVDIKIAQ